MSDIRRFTPLWANATRRLSIGSGLNRFFDVDYRGCRWVYLDLDERAEPTVAGDACAAPFKSESFDFIAAIHVMEHVKDTFKAFDECWRMLAPGGNLLVVVPHALSYAQALPPQHRTGFWPDSFQYFCNNIYETDGHGLGAWEGNNVHPWRIDTLEITPSADHQTLAKYFPGLFGALGSRMFGFFQDIFCVMHKEDVSGKADRN